MLLCGPVKRVLPVKNGGQLHCHSSEHRPNDHLLVVQSGVSKPLPKGNCLLGLLPARSVPEIILTMRCSRLASSLSGAHARRILGPTCPPIQEVRAIMSHSGRKPVQRPYCRPVLPENSHSSTSPQMMWPAVMWICWISGVESDGA
jgi:hypothetical protein